MKIKAMPILHARTFNIDFRTNKLLVAPACFSEDDSLKFCRVTRESTRFLEMAPDSGRFVVVGTGSYSVVGRAVTFSNLYASCNREPKYAIVDKEKGRQACGFVGLMIPAGNVQSPFELSDNLLLDIYEHCIEPCWNDTNAQDTLKMELMDVDIDCINYDANKVPFPLQDKFPVVLNDDDDFRKKIVCCAMQKAFSGECISVCTSVFKEMQDYFFDIITSKYPAHFIPKDVKKSKTTKDLPAKYPIGNDRNTKERIRDKLNKFTKLFNFRKK